MTTQGLMKTAAVVGVALGLAITAPWLFVVPVITVMVWGPQAAFLAVCLYLATRRRAEE
jgi:hypothetical protein